MSFNSNLSGAQVMARLTLANSSLQPGAQIPWTDVTGKPSEFPPEAHGHTLSDISDWAAMLATLQPLLVSGTNIKTVNNTSLLGSGNITIEGGEGGPSATFETVSELEGDWLGTSPEDDPTLLDALTDLRLATSDVAASVGAITTTANDRWEVTAYYDSTLGVDDQRPSLPTTQRVMWPVWRVPTVSVSDGVLTPTLGGAPVNAGPHDTVDPSREVFEHTLTSNIELGNLRAAGDNDLTTADESRSGYFRFVQDATGGRTVSIDPASHYKLKGGMLGQDGQLPIVTTPNAIVLVFYMVVSPTQVMLVVAEPAE